MAADVGCEYALIGTGEERNYMNVDDIAVNTKIHMAYSEGLTPIVFLGENLEDRDAGNTEYILRSQLDGITSGMDQYMVNETIYVYEPLWAIGTGKTINPLQANEACGMIRSYLSLMFGDAGETAQICYGGAINPNNVSAFVHQPDINGAIASGASLRSNDFATLINNATA